MKIAISVTMNFSVPVSVLDDLMFYQDRTRSRSERALDPFHASIHSVTRKPGDGLRLHPFNRECVRGTRSPKKRLEIIHKLLKSEPSKEIRFALPADLFQCVQVAADFYGITVIDQCLTSLSYHAALGRQMREESKAQSPFDNFERKLAKDARRARTATA